MSKTEGSRREDRGGSQRSEEDRKVMKKRLDFILIVMENDWEVLRSGRI